MKIIIGTESFSPNISGVAITTELLAEDLAKTKHEVFVFAPSRDLKTHYDQDFKKIKVLRLRAFPNPFRKGFFVSLLPKKEIAKKVSQIKPDLIHLQDPTSICTALLKVAKQNRIPVIITNHFSLGYVLSYFGYLKVIHRPLRTILSRYLVKFYNQCNFVFCPTQTVKKDLVSLGIKSPIEVISNGVDLERFCSYSSPEVLRLKFRLPLNPIVLYVGRIDKDKNINVLIEAIPRVRKEINAHFVFVGQGEELPKIKKKVTRLGLERVVTFLGWINHNSDDLPGIYQLASLFVIPSMVETQSIVTLEALASGLPVVAAEAGALPELVKDKENGFLFSGGSKNMAQGIVKILEDKKMASEMGKKSLQIVSQHRIEESFKKIVEIYEKVLCKF